MSSSSGDGNAQEGDRGTYFNPGLGMPSDDRAKWAYYKKLPTQQLMDEVTRLGVRFNQLPSLQFWAPLFGRNEAWRNQRVARRVLNNSPIFHPGRRDLTSEEVNAIAEHAVEAARVRAWDRPIWLGAAAWCEYRGRQKNRFPFFTPGNFNPSVFPTARVALLTGRAAVGAWGVVRFGAYGFVFYQLSQAFFPAYENLKLLFGITSDPRLKDFIKTLQEEFEAKAKQNQRGSPIGFPRTAARTGPAGEQQPPPPREISDDASTQFYGREDTAPVSPDWTKLSPSSSPQQPSKEAVTRRQPTTSNDDDSFLFDDDDASPVAPSARQPQRPSATPSASSGGSNTWEKLRQQARETQDGEPQTSKSADSYSYRQSEAERTYAKEQAQKEFDAMLERERQGKADSNRRF